MTNTKSEKAGQRPCIVKESEVHELAVDIRGPFHGCFRNSWTVKRDNINKHTLTPDANGRRAVPGIHLEFPCGHEEFWTVAEAKAARRMFRDAYDCAMARKNPFKTRPDKAKVYYVGQNTDKRIVCMFNTFEVADDGRPWTARVENDRDDAYTFPGDEEVEVLLALSNALDRVIIFNEAYKVKLETPAEAAAQEDEECEVVP